MNTHLEELANAGFRLFPLRGGDKAKLPRDDGYATNNYGVADLTGNVGMIVDQEHVDVDLDWPETQRLAGLQMPETAMVFGRGEPFRIRHLIYRAKIDEPIDFKLPKVTGHTLEGDHAYMVLQLRTARGDEPYHVMIPPSVHPEGERLVWYFQHRTETPSVLPAEADGEWIVKCAGIVAALAFFLRFYPGKGARDDFATAVIGALVRGGWEDKEIEWFVRTLASHAGDEQADMRSSKCEDTRKRIREGKKVRGLTSMPGLLGVPPEWIREVACWLGIRKGRGTGPAVFDTGIIKDAAQQAWSVLEDYTVGGDPGVYAYGDALARVAKDRIEILDRQRLRYELNRCAKWLRPGDEKQPWIVSNAPLQVVDDMLASRADHLALPPLVSVATTPIFTRAGKLITKRGYDFDAECFVAPTVAVSVPENPSREQVQQAVARLLEPLADFPFVDASDRANALAMMIEPYVRDLFECAPLYFINKPTAGTGASLLVYAATYPMLGCAPAAMKPPTREEEMEKLLFSMLMEGSKLAFLDNANNLNFSSLAAALTADRYKGRLLGVSRTMEFPVRCMWIATGNNPDTTNEMYRRFADIRLDAEMEFPEDRAPDEFAIPDLKAWVRDHRAALVEAALTIIQAWVCAGMPKGSKSKASFEGWAAVLSGILENAGVEGFLDTPISRRPMDQKTEELRAVLAQWLMLSWGKKPKQAAQMADLNAIDWSMPVKASELWTMIRCAGLPFETLRKDPARAVGDKLRDALDRTFELETAKGSKLKVVLRGRQRDNSMRWWLDFEQVDDVCVSEWREPPF
jgi:hypothetical protein